MAGRVFLACDEAIVGGVPIRAARAHGTRFQNWFEDRLGPAGLAYAVMGVNTFPDFTLTDHDEGYELKGLESPGRRATYDANSQLPGGTHAGRRIYYVFGRYPPGGGEALSVLDLVICDGSYLNPESLAVRTNASLRDGRYGDLLIRNRRMYVPPTPYALAMGLDGNRTLILPEGTPAGDGLRVVGSLTRREVGSTLDAYRVEMTSNRLEEEWINNPTADRVHRFTAFRGAGDQSDGEVSDVLHAAVVAAAEGEAPEEGSPADDDLQSP